MGQALLRRAISVGGGEGRKEMELLKAGCVDHFDIFEAAEARIELGRKTAAAQGLASRVTFHHVRELGLPRASDYDLVFWNAAQHHMSDAREAVESSRDALADGGWFAMNEYVGPDRFQWSSQSLKVCDALRRVLPAAVFESQDGRKIRRETPRIDKHKLIASDPTEAADSMAIPGAVRSVFRDIEFRELGGALYHIAFQKILAQIDDVKHAQFIELALVW